MKKVFFLFLTAVFIQAIFAQNPPRSVQAVQPSLDLTQYGVKIEPDKRLIVVMATLEAGGMETPLTESGKIFRQTLRQDSQNVSPELRQRIKNFIERYKANHATETAAQINAPFVSLAFALSPAPELADPPRSEDLPANVLEILDFGALAREFYESSGIEARLPDYVKTYQAEGDKMRVSAAEMVTDILGYLHTRPELTVIERVRTEEKSPKDKKKTETKIKINERERRFFIVPDLLAPFGTINFRNIRDDYYAVVPPDTNLSASEVRRAYLQFVTDPLILKNAKDIATFNAGIKQLLDERRKTDTAISPDVFLAVSRSFVAAVEAKQIESKKIQAATAEARRKIDAAQTVAAKEAISAALRKDKQIFADETALKLAENYEQGAVLDFYFADQLKGLEDSGFDISGSFRDMILSLNPAKESARLTEFAEARQRALASRGANLNKNLELPKKLLEIDEIIKAKNYTEADARLQKLLQENPNEPRIYYTLGRVASSSAEGTFDEGLLSERLGRAAAYYRNAILLANKNTDPALLSLSRVALGRILEFNDQTDAALKEYEAAISLGKIEGGAYNEAVAAKEKLTKKP
ncbi:MAG: tetratricopeptide repeat protein [Pyrinomonadaceae bacterium]